MKKETIIHKLFIGFLKKIGIIETVEIDKSIMCRKAVESGACPNCCEYCAWSKSEMD